MVSLWQEKFHLELKDQIRCTVRLLGVPEDLSLEVDGLVADLDQAAGAAAERHRPTVIASYGAGCPLMTRSGLSRCLVGEFGMWTNDYQSTCILGVYTGEGSGSNERSKSR